MLALVLACAAHEIEASVAYAEDADARDTPAEDADARETPADVEAARALFEKGVGYVKVGRFPAAEGAFFASWDRAHRPNAAFNLAAVRYRLGNHVGALRALDDYAATAKRAHRLQAKAAHLRALLEPLVAHLTLELVPADAAVFVDERRQPGTGAQRELAAEPGIRVLKVSAPGYAPELEEVTLVAGAEITRKVALAREVADARPPDEPQPPPLPSGSTPSLERQPWGGWRPLTFGLMGAGTVGLATAGALSIAAVRRDRASDDQCDGNACSPAGHAERGTARRLGNMATGAIVAGGALLGAALVVRLVGGTLADERTTQVVASVGPGMAGLQLRGEL